MGGLSHSSCAFAVEAIKKKRKNRVFGADTVWVFFSYYTKIFCKYTKNNAKNHTNFTIYTARLANQTEPLYIAQHVHLLHGRRGAAATSLEGYGKCLRVFYVNHGLKLAIARLKNAQTHWLTVHDCPQLVLMLG